MKRIAWRLWLVLAWAALCHSVWMSLAPPDLSGDAARLGLHTFDWLQRGAWPFYIYHLFAPNPLIIWLQAIAFSLGGPTVAAVQAVTVVAGVLCAGLTYIAAVTLFRAQGLRVARRAGLLAGLGLPLLPALNHFAHGGTEHILLPLFTLLAVAALWRGLRSGRYADFVLAGAALGLSQYAYIVARVLPIALGAALLAAMWRDRVLWRRWRGLLLAALVAGLIALPQWTLFVAAPYTLFARTGQEAGRFIFAEPQALTLFGVKLWHQALALGWEWQSGYNPSGRGLLPGIGFVAAGAGVISLMRARTSAALFTLTVTGLLMLPDLLTVEGDWPSATRLIGAMPLWVMLAGFGAARLWRWLELRGGWVSRLAPALVSVWLGAGLEAQWHRLALVAPQVLAEPGREWMSSLVEQAEADYILAHTGAAMLIPSDEYQRAPLAFRLAAHYRERTGALTAPLSPGEAVKIVMPVDPLRPTTDGVPPRFIADEWILLRDGGVHFLPPLPNSVEQLAAETTLLARNGAPAARVSAGLWRGARLVPAEGEFAFERGLRVAPLVADALIPGEPLIVTLLWSSDDPVTEDFQLFTQLLDRREAMVAAVHDWPLRGTYRLNAWRAGEGVPLSYSFAIPADLRPGEYRLITGVYDIARQARVPALSGGEVAVVARFKVAPKVEPFAPEHTVSATFGERLQLIGYTFTEGGVRMQWQASRQPDFNYTLFLHAFDAAGNLIAQVDSEPLAGDYPTGIWETGETVVWEVPFAVPEAATTVRAGWYRWDTGERLPLTVAGQPAPEDALPLRLTLGP
jgi:hypothetical protein